MKSVKVIKNIKLHEISTKIKHEFDEEVLEFQLNETSKLLSALQDKMYAHNKYSVLICLQGMDTAGKDSLIREIFKEFNARGVNVHSFKVPSEKELKHDFLWRHYLALPERGKFSVFNRTHYENVLVTRVNPEFLLNENLPNINHIENIDDDFWKNRFESIKTFEKHIASNGTIIFKFYLHLSKEEQRKRLLRRIEKKKHQWKFAPSDMRERNLWDDYQRCYEDAINSTSTDDAPWYVVPADDKKACRLMVAKTILETLEKYSDIKEPDLDPEIEAKLGEYYHILKDEK